MFKPAPMMRVTISGLSKDLETVSNNLAEERLIHLVEYGNDCDGFETGETLSYGEKTSDALIRVRSLIKMLDVTPMPPSVLRTSEELSNRLNERLDDVENKAVDLRDRIDSVKSTKKITSAMKLVAGARLKRAQIAATTSRPYVAKIEGLINNITSSVQNIENLPKIVKGSESNKIHLIVLITSDRGLCGSFNTAMVKLAKKRINELLNSNKIVKILCVGKKGYNQLKREYQDIIIDTIILPYKSDKVDYEFAQKISHRILMMHENNEFDFASIVFSLFQSPLKQEPQLKQIIPVLNNDEKATKNNLESIDKKISELQSVKLKKGNLTNSRATTREKNAVKITYPIFQKGKNGDVYAFIYRNFSVEGIMYLYKKTETGWEVFAKVQIFIA